MKRIFIYFLLLALMPIYVMAQDATTVVVNGIKYSLDTNTKEAAVIVNADDHGNQTYAGEVTIPGSITYNGESYNVTSIADWAFCLSKDLNSVNIGNKVTKIGQGAFSECKDLTAITLPNSVTEIGYLAFSNCAKLTSVNISDLAAWCNISFNSYSSNPFCSTTENCHLILDGMELVSFKIPEGVTSIGNYNFVHCNQIKTVTLPKSLTSIGEDAFSSCTSLAEIDLSNTNLTDIGARTFFNCSRLENVSIPQSVTTINESTFALCTGLKDVTLHEGVTSIGNYAFSQCYDMEYFNIPDGVTDIGEGAFSICPNLQRVKIGMGLKNIGDFAFWSCTALKTVRSLATTPPATGDLVFGNIPNDAKLFVYNLEKILNAYGTATTWKEFSGIEGLALYVNADNISFSMHPETKEASVCQKSEHFYDFVGSNGIITSEYYVGEAIIPESVDFAGDTYLVTGIGEEAFINCLQLTSVVIPANVTAIGDKAFWNCIGLAKITCQATVPPVGNRNVFEVEGEEDLIYHNAILYLPEGTIDSYKSQAPWKYFNNYPVSEVDITITAAGMATYCSPYDLDFGGIEGVKAYIITRFISANSSTNAVRVTDVPAGTGVILIGNPGNYTIPTTTSYSIYENMLVGVTESTYLEPTDGMYTNFVLYGTCPADVCFMQTTAGYLPANKAYLQLPSEEYNNSTTGLSINFDDDTNGIREAVKEDLDNAAWYTIDGQKLGGMPTRSGMYIRNGKKIIVK